MSAEKKEIYIASRAVGKSTVKMCMQRLRGAKATPGLLVNCRKCDKFTTGVSVSSTRIICAQCGEPI
jgi:ribosomal protein S27E